MQRIGPMTRLGGVVLALAWAAAPRPGLAESLTYEAYQLVSPSKRRLMDQGTVDYDPLRDVQTVRRTAQDGELFWTRGLPLPNGFWVSAQVQLSPIQQLYGFGLRLMHRRHPAGFSWEWYDWDDDDDFKKRQGVGRVRTVLHKTADTEQLVRVEFLDDTELRFCSNLMRCKPGENTHALIIRRGSVLALGAPVGVDSIPTPAPPTPNETAAASSPDVRTSRESQGAGIVGPEGVVAAPGVSTTSCPT